MDTFDSIPAAPPPESTPPRSSRQNPHCCEAGLHAVMQQLGDAVITTDPNGDVRTLNRVAEQLLGGADGLALGRPVGRLFSSLQDDFDEPVHDTLQRAMAQRSATRCNGARLLHLPGGARRSYATAAAPLLADTGELRGGILMLRDLTELHHDAVRQRLHGGRDVLTGLANRAELEDKLQRVMLRKRSRPSATDLPVLLHINLDEFHLVNDACGYAAGDALLQEVGALIELCVRRRDTLTRLAADEFVALIDDCGTERARLVAQQICDRLDDFRHVHHMRRFRIGASIGLLTLDGRWHSVTEALQAANIACQAAKEAGRSRVHVWDHNDLHVARRRVDLRWADRLEQALDNDEFALHAQRIVPLTRSEGLHCEVLLRLPQPAEPDPDADTVPAELGRATHLATPGQFMSAAERFHIATRIDRWVLRQVLRTLAQHGGRLDGLTTVAINLSGQSLGDRHFLRRAIELIEASSVDPRKLCFEITETAAITNLDSAVAFVDAMHERGVRIALDDFGAGASHFGYLRKLKVDLLKIDGQFVRAMLSDPLGHTAVRCFCEVAKVVGATTVAECVETPETLAALRHLGVDQVQGWLFHRAEPLEALLAEQAEPTN